MKNLPEGAGLAVVLVTLVGIAIGRYPWLRMNRATIALVGATVLVALRVLPLDDAFAAVDLRTLALLLGMMVLTVSDVPAVLLLGPLGPAAADPERAWLTLAMATTLAGNLTLLGSVANLIVAELAGARGVRLSFGEYLRAGVPIKVLSLAWGVAWLEWSR